LIDANNWNLVHYEGGNPLNVIGYHDKNKNTKEEHMRFFISKINDSSINDDELRYYATLLAMSKGPNFSQIVFEELEQSLINKIGITRTGESHFHSPIFIFLKILELNPHEETVPLAIEMINKKWDADEPSLLIRTVLASLLEVLAAIPIKESLLYLVEDLSWWHDNDYIAKRWDVFHSLNMSCVFTELAEAPIDNLDDKIHLQSAELTFDFLIDDFDFRDMDEETINDSEALMEAFLLKWANEGNIYNGPNKIYDIDDLCPNLSSKLNMAQEIDEIRASNYFLSECGEFRKLEFENRFYLMW